MLATISRVLIEVTQAEQIYLYVFGGDVDHLHVHLAPHHAGDALNNRMIRGELQEEVLPGGDTRIISQEYPPLPEQEHFKVADLVEQRLSTALQAKEGSTSERRNPMSQTILIGRNQEMLELPQTMWEKHLEEIPKHGPKRLAFMSPDHHRVRYFVVRELPIAGHALTPEYISESLRIPLERILQILGELEDRLTFLVRNQYGAVSWAFPVTVEPTPHRLQFNTGEQIYAA